MIIRVSVVLRRTVLTLTDPERVIIKVKGAVSRGFSSRFVKTSLKLRLNAFIHTQNVPGTSRGSLSSEFLQGEQTIISFQ